MIVKVKKLNPEAVVPTYAKQGDAGLDLTAISKHETIDYVEYGTGLSFEIPEGHVGLLFPRSSISKKPMQLCNSVGVVDSGYRGEVKLRFKPSSERANPYGFYNVGDRIAQIVILPYPQVVLREVEELEDSERADGGFGHSGLN